MNKENITNLRLWLKEDLPYREKHNLECALAVIDELEGEYQELKLTIRKRRKKMDDKEIKDIYNYYSLGRKHEKEEFKKYVLYFINANIEVNNKDMEERKKYNNIDTIQEYEYIEKIKTENAILTLLKDYIELY
jgi:hypothetical protein